MFKICEVLCIFVTIAGCGSADPSEESTHDHLLQAIPVSHPTGVPVGGGGPVLGSGNATQEQAPTGILAWRNGAWAIPLPPQPPGQPLAGVTMTVAGPNNGGRVFAHLMSSTVGELNLTSPPSTGTPFNISISLARPHVTEDGECYWVLVEPKDSGGGWANGVTTVSNVRFFIGDTLIGMGNLPTSRTITLSPGDPIPAALLDELQDMIIKLGSSKTDTFSISSAAVGAGVTHVVGASAIAFGTSSQSNILGINIREGRTITAWSLPINKVSATGTILAQLWRTQPGSAPVQIGVNQTNGAASPGNITLGQSGLTEDVLAGYGYFIDVVGGGITGDQAFDYQVVSQLNP